MPPLTAQPPRRAFSVVLRILIVAALIILVIAVMLGVWRDLRNKPHRRAALAPLAA